MEQNINDENDVDALMLTQDKNLRCIAILTSKIMTIPEKFTLVSIKNCKSVVTGKIQLSHTGNSLLDQSPCCLNCLVLLNKFVSVI